MAQLTQSLLAVLFIGGAQVIGSAPAYAADSDDAFREAVRQYQAANPKPVFTEEARKYKVQAEFAEQQKRPDLAIALYGKALLAAPWWAEGHYNLALVLAEQKQYRDALREMNRYLMLAPDGGDARTAQDRIYQWEIMAPPEAGKPTRDCPTCPEMVRIPAGSFQMGSDKGVADERPLHDVTIAQPFAIGKTEVTQAQWHAVMHDDPSYFKGCGDNCPVEQVSWDDVQQFIDKLNAQTGKHYRLPTEAEWEYACRAGKQQAYCGSDNADDVSWNSSNSGSFLFNKPHPVATKQPNDFGLYDMSGNVWEWVQDNYHDSYTGAPADGSAWTDGSIVHVLRGGSWGYDRQSSRAAARSKYGVIRYYSYGFRVAQTLP